MNLGLWTVFLFRSNFLFLTKPSSIFSLAFISLDYLTPPSFPFLLPPQLPYRPTAIWLLQKCLRQSVSPSDWLSVCLSMSFPFSVNSSAKVEAIRLLNKCLRLPIYLQVCLSSCLPHFLHLAWICLPRLKRLDCSTSVYVCLCIYRSVCLHVCHIFSI